MNEEDSTAKSNILILITVTLNDKPSHRRVLTLVEVAKKAALGAGWKDIANGLYIRKLILYEHGQELLSVSKEDYCSRCNLDKVTHPLQPYKLVRDNVRS